MSRYFSLGRLLLRNLEVSRLDFADKIVYIIPDLAPVDYKKIRVEVDKHCVAIVIEKDRPVQQNTIESRYEKFE